MSGALRQAAGRRKSQVIGSVRLALGGMIGRMPRINMAEGPVKIVVTSVLVDDQAKALAFYRDVLGFELKHDISMGEHRWLTLTSPGDPDRVELLLEPDVHPAARPFKSALKQDGIPYTSLGVEDVRAEYARLCAAGVHFTQPPTAMGAVTTAIFDDTCGNLIQIAQQD
jgi:catechol 2,3-dioxygenase-like lactoylglutathione lyase family enzyme